MKRLKRTLQRMLRYLQFFTVKRVVGMLVLLLALFALVIIALVASGNVAVLNPAGIIADKEKDLFVFTFLLGMVVIIPVFIMLFAFAWRYREGNKKRTAKYTPDVGGGKLLEVIWWGIPIIIIGILGVVTWISTHDLDPHKKLESDNKAINVQVVAMEWKWLFIYPDLGIASLNELRFPEDTPVDFQITADAPMSAFWIPNLGSQIYAMKGMATKLSLMADRTGEFYGTNTNINGEGYSKMNFIAHSVSEADFDDWVQQASASPQQLSWEMYESLVEASVDDGVVLYGFVDDELFQAIIDQYMSHGGHDSHDIIESMEDR